MDSTDPYGSNNLDDFTRYVLGDTQKIVFDWRCKIPKYNDSILRDIINLFKEDFVILNNPEITSVTDDLNIRVTEKHNLVELLISGPDLELLYKKIPGKTCSTAGIAIKMMKDLGNEDLNEDYYLHWSNLYKFFKWTDWRT